MIGTKRMREAMALIEQYGQIDGDHHKAWVIDQVARKLMHNDYDEWVVQMMDGEDGPETYGYDTGIAP